MHPLAARVSYQFSNVRQLLSQVRAKILRKRNFARSEGSVQKFGTHEKLHQYSHPQTDRQANPHQKSEDSLIYFLWAQYMYVYIHVLYTYVHVYMYVCIYI